MCASGVCEGVSGMCDDVCEGYVRVCVGVCV